MEKDSLKCLKKYTLYHTCGTFSHLRGQPQKWIKLSQSHEMRCEGRRVFHRFLSFKFLFPFILFSPFASLRYLPHPMSKKNEETVLGNDHARLAQVMEVLGRTGSRGGVTQVRVRLLAEDGSMQESGRTIIRNVKGPCRKDDVLALMETDREARRLR